MLDTDKLVIRKISSPYNFVPLSSQIVFPDWGNQVSQDFPFSDGMDGELKVMLEAQTPIFVRNGSTGKKEESFCKEENGRYFIPATTLKGVVRSVLEIASYGKMQHIADKRYAIRDLNLKSYTDRFAYHLKPIVKAGWLDVSDDENWKIVPCKFAQWDRSVINDSFGNKRMSAGEKYQAFLKISPLEKCGEIHHVDETTNPNYKGVPYDEVLFVKDGSKRGKIVLTGQPQDYTPGKKSCKKKEFFFYDEQENEAFAVDCPENIYTDEDGHKVYPNRNDFVFIHKNQSPKSDSDQSPKNDSDQSPKSDYDLWFKNSDLKKKIDQYFKGRIPVFYIREDNKLRFGFAMLFRLAGDVSVGEAARNTNEKHFPAYDSKFEPDLADMIFGYTSREKSLKGRVQFSACFAPESTKEDDIRTLILGTPKPTFYPAYIKQNKELNRKEQYKTFLNKDAELRGWKRYPALGKLKTDMRIENENMAVHFATLPEGTVFEGIVRYHNLRPIELGALIWAIQMNNPDYYCHTLGMAKPYGYGRVKVSISGIDEERKRELTAEFEKYIYGKLSELYPKAKNFPGLPEIRQLLNMARYGKDISAKGWDFDYPLLEKLEEDPSNPDVRKKVNEFTEAKNACCVLGEYPAPEKTLQEHTPKKAVITHSPEEEFIKNCPKKIDQCIKILQKGEFHFTEEQIARIKNLFRTELKNKYNPQSKNLLELLEKCKKN